MAQEFATRAMKHEDDSRGRLEQGEGRGPEVITRARLALAVQKVGGDPTAPPSR